MTVVAGVDGCRAGWVVVKRELEDPASAEARLCPTFADVLAMAPAAQVIAVDMPIGLPRSGQRGGRRCDIEARAKLGARQSAVFAVPARPAVMEADYRRACEVALAYSKPPLKVSKQIYNLFPKIREVDAALSPELQNRVVECHPELSFWALNGEVPLGEPKKVKSQPFGPGLALRRGLLAAEGYTERFLEDMEFRPRQCGADDLLDAAACAWTAARIGAGKGQRFPDSPECDARGLRMEIWC